MLPNFNANIVVLIPKTPDVDSVSQFRPITLANFKFKIISKILTDRLAQILPSIISTEQRGFIKGRQIKDCICLTSEGINLLHLKFFGDDVMVFCKGTAANIGVLANLFQSYANIYGQV
ncbi:RNA-directed DNA polymerase (Reverse transcriptase), partial [Trifolium medium]|nr:RNA-directed DNA polymerase (Reverse transcriptase) [Trifolium medium]